MTAGANVGHGTTNGSHWAKRSQALLAPRIGRAHETAIDRALSYAVQRVAMIRQRVDQQR